MPFPLPSLRPPLNCLLRIGLGLVCCTVAPHFLSAQGAGGPAKLTFTKVLQGSVPEYLAITVASDASATYDGRKLSDPAAPRTFKLSAATTRRLFELAAGLDNFKSVELESHRKVADLGLKTFIYEAGGEKRQVQFNYTLRREAQELTDLFEKISGVQQHLTALEYSMKYDHLGLPRELSQIQIDLENKVLADPALMVPALEQIARNPKFLHLAQARAQNILQRLQNSN